MLLSEWRRLSVTTSLDVMTAGASLGQRVSEEKTLK